MKKYLFLVFTFFNAGVFCSCSETPRAKDIVDSSLVKIPTPSFVPSESEKGIFSFSFHGQYFEVNARSAGRISAFSINGKNCLSTKEVNAVNWGTSLWPSPQAAWGWPPSKALDANPYSGGILNDSALEFRSEKDSLLGIVFVKRYEVSPSDTAILVTYTMENRSGKKQSLALWEISRVAPDGLTFYPTGKGEKLQLLAPLTEDLLGITWFKYDFNKMTFKDSDVPKLIHDGAKGWLAHVSGDMILVKKFQDISPEETAPGEGELELYANPDKSYVEIEQQGPYKALDNSETMQWQVKWYLRKLPKGISIEPGSKELIRFVEQVLN